MADTIRITKSNLVLLETGSATEDTVALRSTQMAMILLTGLNDVSAELPTGRKTIICPN